ncbi:hypothetical protein Taro_026952 [Colocasia esculenta]|uniref:DJ-1/PfpI domain-containing protein n=1 Tax=Colocasia esculenta TaxID=4460 RepID=A0A843VEA6_COLES|nr:hypothetical protein [Colocasia esculenta]
MEAVITIDILRRAGADVTVASVEKELRVDASWGIMIVADSFVSDCAGSAFDLISLPVSSAAPCICRSDVFGLSYFLPLFFFCYWCGTSVQGGMPGSATLRDCAILEEMVKKHAASGGLYAAICAAPAVALASWGLLNGLKMLVLLEGKEATCYPSFMEKLPSHVTAVESRVQQDGQAITSRGAGTAMEFALTLVEQLYGKDKADEVAQPMVMRPHHGEEFNLKEVNTQEWKCNNPPQLHVRPDNRADVEAPRADLIGRPRAPPRVGPCGRPIRSSRGASMSARTTGADGFLFAGRATLLTDRT